MGMPAKKRRTTPVTVRPPRTAPLSAEDHQQAVTALAAMIHEWWQRNAATTLVPQGTAAAPKRLDPPGLKPETSA
jgi:hypothetical protein